MFSWQKGWQGDFSGLTVSDSVIIRPEAGYSPLADFVALSPHDFCWRCYFRMPFYLIYAVPGHLDKQRLQTAASTVLSAYPALGARLNLSPSPPKLNIMQPEFQLGFASWSDGSVAQLTEQYHWIGSADTHPELPAPPPFADTFQAKEAAHGKSTLFSIRVTSLGDGNSLVAISWMHYLANVNPMQDAIVALSAAYRGDTSSGLIPASPFPWRNLWPSQLRLPAYPDMSPEELAAAVTFDEDLLAPGPFCVADENNHEWMNNPFILTPKGPRNALLTVALKQKDLVALKTALQGHATTKQLPFYSTNDVVLGLAWMLQNDALGESRPSQGAGGSSRQAVLIIDPATCPDGGIPANANPPGFLGNNTCAAFLSVPSDGTNQASAEKDKHEGLLQALGSIVATVRQGILERRKPGGCLEGWMGMEPMIPSQSYKGMMEAVGAAGMDALFTNMNSYPKHKQLHFDTGPVMQPNCHFGMQRAKELAIVELPDGKGLRMVVFEEALPRLLCSPVLPALAPASGLINGILH